MTLNRSQERKAALWAIKTFKILKTQIHQHSAAVSALFITWISAGVLWGDGWVKSTVGHDAAVCTEEVGVQVRRHWRFLPVLTLQWVPIWRLQCPPCPRRLIIIINRQIDESAYYSEVSLTDASSRKPPQSRVSLLDVDPSILLPLPAALRPIVSASLWSPGWEERRRDEDGARKEWGGGEPSPSSRLRPITALLRREPPLLAVSVQTRLPSWVIGNINSARKRAKYNKMKSN